MLFINMKLGLILCYLFCLYCDRIYAGDDIYDFYHETIATAASQLDRQLPEGAMKSLLQYPELKVEPYIKGDDGLIHYFGRKPESYQKYTNRIDELLKGYESNVMSDSSHFVDCSSYNGYRPPEDWSRTCRVDIRHQALNEDCSKEDDYGFKSGYPCVVLSLDRVYNWVPEPYTNETVPDAIRSSWNPGEITVTCEGADVVSVDNIRSADTVPPFKGFPVKYFPFNKQEGWLSPLVFVKLDTSLGIALDVKCTVWAKNMIHRDLLNTGSVKFTVMVDD